MGCDIHIVLERRIDGAWIGLHDFPYFTGRSTDPEDAQYWPGPEATQRCYERFSRLAGVRRPGPAPRGIPDDASQLARLRLSEWKGDAHSVSWMSLEEALPIFIETADFREDSIEAKFPASFIFGEAADEIGKHRIIFWFDN